MQNLASPVVELTKFGNFAFATKIDWPGGLDRRAGNLLRRGGPEGVQTRAQGTFSNGAQIFGNFLNCEELINQFAMKNARRTSRIID
ncbi:hypothetical protein CTI12_AA187950 [Artemisia annua]|uniref:Uncharacterized protein n=1 Tax=Artemisia annua TaxID=35608 RepID=A0A2U1P396_ARTAN|nr:hypothetical protein CTI12_AA187950 [Artemisia annua]